MKTTSDGAFRIAVALMHANCGARRDVSSLVTPDSGLTTAGVAAATVGFPTGVPSELFKRVIYLEILSPDTKITWAASGRMGPFKARDFCKLVHFRTLSDGTLAQVFRRVEHPAAPRSNQYVRSEVLVAGNFMRAVPGDASRTEFLMVTCAGAMLVNSLCAKSPVDFIRKLDTAAQKLTRQIQEAARADSDRVGDSTELLFAPPPSDRASSGGIWWAWGRIRGGKASYAGAVAYRRYR